jgi:hypothetical protein
MGFLDRFRRSPRLALPSPEPSGQGETGLVRADGWYSALSGFGTSKDKRRSVSLRLDPITDDFAEYLWRGNDIGARIIETPPNEALRPGFELKMEDKELSEKVMARVEDLKVVPAFLKAMHFERAYGGGAIWPVINDSNPKLEEPLNLARVSEIKHLVVFEPRECRPREYYSDTDDEKLGEPMTYEVAPRFRGVGAVDGGRQIIHETRLITFPGIRVSRGQVTVNGWGDSAFTRVWEVLRDYGISWDATAILLHEFSQASMKIKGLAELIARDKNDAIRARIEAVELARSTINAVLMDSEEQFERTQTPVTGLRELLDGFAQRVAAAANQPVTLLMGMSPSGLNATGESDIRFFYDRVDVDRQLKIRPRLEHMIKLIMLDNSGPTGGKEPDVWSVDFNPLWQPSDKEKAETRKIVSETDKNYVDMTAVTPDEVAVSRFGGDTYSMEMVIEAPEDREEPEEEAVETPEPGAEAGPGAADPATEIQKQAMNGAQVASLVSVVEQVNTKVISRKSGINILKVAFQLTEAEAEAIIGDPVEPPAPEPAPVPPGPPPPGPPPPPAEGTEAESEPPDERLDAKRHKEVNLASSRVTRRRRERTDRVEERGGRWLVVDRFGDILSEHDDEDAANEWLMGDRG